MTDNEKYRDAVNALLDHIASGTGRVDHEAIRSYAEAYKALAEGRAWESIPNQSH